MNFKQNTGVSIQEAFEEYHTNNPMVYAEYKKYIFKAIKKKKKKLSSKLVINVIRWDKFMETEEKNLFTDKDGVKKKFRISDAYTSRYARLFAKDYPELSTIFNYSELRS